MSEQELLSTQNKNNHKSTKLFQDSTVSWLSKSVNTINSCCWISLSLFSTIPLIVLSCEKYFKKAPGDIRKQRGTVVINVKVKNESVSICLENGNTACLHLFAHMNIYYCSSFQRHSLFLPPFPSQSTISVPITVEIRGFLVP